MHYASMSVEKKCKRFTTNEDKRRIEHEQYAQARMAGVHSGWVISTPGPDIYGNRWMAQHHNRFYGCEIDPDLFLYFIEQFGKKNTKFLGSWNSTWSTILKDGSLALYSAKKWPSSWIMHHDWFDFVDKCLATRKLPEGSVLDFDPTGSASPMIIQRLRAIAMHDNLPDKVALRMHFSNSRKKFMDAGLAINLVRTGIMMKGNHEIVYEEEFSYAERSGCATSKQAMRTCQFILRRR